LHTAIKDWMWEQTGNQGNAREVHS